MMDGITPADIAATSRLVADQAAGEDFSEAEYPDFEAENVHYERGDMD